LAVGMHFFCLSYARVSVEVRSLKSSLECSPCTGLIEKNVSPARSTFARVRETPIQTRGLDS
jgi:hypothetical protein